MMLLRTGSYPDLSEGGGAGRYNRNSMVVSEMAPSAHRMVSVSVREAMSWRRVEVALKGTDALRRAASADAGN